MTNDEKTLTHAMQSACGLVGDVANLRAQAMETPLGHGLWAKLLPSGTIRLRYTNGVTTWVTPDQFQALERFAEQIGWRPQ